MATTSDHSVSVLVLGAGPCGLGAARHLEHLGRSDWMLVEAAATPGGLASSFVDPQGFTWDIGGHVQFSHYQWFDEAMQDLLGPQGWSTHRRESWIWLCDRLVPYPLQNNVHRLPPAELEACLLGLLDVAVRPRPRPSTFEEWVDGCFGEGLAELFMRPYNEKVWAHPLSAMNVAWMGERVAVPDLRRILHQVAHDTTDTGWGPNATFQFPRHGGTGAVWSALAERLPADHLVFGERAVAIDLDRHECTTSSGRTVRYGALVSTIPLRDLVVISGQHQFGPLAAEGLLCSSSNIVGLGLSGRPPEHLRDKSWLYFPEPHVPFYRATVFSNFAPANVPDPSTQWSLMFEVAESAHRPVDRRTLVDDVIAGAVASRLVDDPARIVSRWSHREPYGYPTPGVHRDRALAEIVPFFDAADVHSRGRFGTWKYEVSNQDHTFMQGVEVVERLVNGREEITAFDADHANSTKHPWPFERWAR